MIICFATIFVIFLHGYVQNEKIGIVECGGQIFVYILTINFISISYLSMFFVIVHTNEYTYANNREQNYYYYYYYMSYNMYIYVVQYAKLNKIKDKGNNTFEAPSTRLNTL